MNEVNDAYSRNSGPVHSWFQLSYSNYLVIPRAILQAMPVEWQKRFVTCLDEARAACAPLNLNDRYTVLLRGPNGRFEDDPYADYRHPVLHILDVPEHAKPVTGRVWPDGIAAALQEADNETGELAAKSSDCNESSSIELLNKP